MAWNCRVIVRSWAPRAVVCWALVACCTLWTKTGTSFAAESEDANESISHATPIEIGDTPSESFTNDDVAVQRRLANTARYLASDELEGRGLGTRGITLAADYIASEFRSLGLKTDLCRGGPFQVFPAPLEPKLGPQNRLAVLSTPSGVSGQTARTELTVGKDYTPLAVSDSSRFDLPLVFAGFGVTDRAAGYDDYSGVDVTGKAVVVLRSQPSWLSGARKGARHTLVRHKVSNAFEHGAAAVLICSALADSRSGDGTAGSAVSPDPLLRFATSGIRCLHRGMPVIHWRRATIEPAVRAVYGMDLSSLEAKLERSHGGQSRPLTGWKIAGQTDVVRLQTDAKNVVALLPGRSRGHGEAILIGAHYDHFGYGKQDTRTKPEGKDKRPRPIYYGADDNASGVATILEIARYLASRPRPPVRDVVFVSFCAEEMGLLGSRYYVNHPIVPIERTTAMINFDMVGRLRDNHLYIRGSITAKDWSRMLQEINQRHRFAADIQDRFGASDQLPFYGKDVPILHFFTGRHEDYHEPTDRFEKLNLPGMCRIARYAEEVVESMANAPSRAVYVAATMPPEEGEAYFGAFGDYTEGESGYTIGPVVEGGPADRAGVRNGDLVVQFGDSRIATVDDFNEAMSHYVGGEKIRLVVKRDNQVHTLQMTLGRAPSSGLPSAPPREAKAGAAVHDAPKATPRESKLATGPRDAKTETAPPTGKRRAATQ